MPYWTGQRLVAGGRAVGPELAVNASGRALAVWDSETGPDCAEAPASLTCIHTIEARDKPAGGASWAR